MAEQTPPELGRRMESLSIRFSVCRLFTVCIGLVQDGILSAKPKRTPSGNLWTVTSTLSRSNPACNAARRAFDLFEYVSPIK